MEFRRYIRGAKDAALLNKGPEERRRKRAPENGDGSRKKSVGERHEREKYFVGRAVACSRSEGHACLRKKRVQRNVIAKKNAVRSMLCVSRRPGGVKRQSSKEWRVLIVLEQ